SFRTGALLDRSSLRVARAPSMGVWPATVSSGVMRVLVSGGRTPVDSRSRHSDPSQPANEGKRAHGIVSSLITPAVAEATAAGMPRPRLLSAILLAALAVPLPTYAASKAKQCLEACGAVITSCASTCDAFGNLDRACRKAVVARCKQLGVGV